MEATSTIQRIIDSDYRLAVLDTAEADRLVALFKRLTLTTGRAVYHWTPGSGLCRLGVEHIFIPRTQGPAELLAYVSASRHYGIYLLQHFQDALARASIQRSLEVINQRDDGVRRLVIMMGNGLCAPQGLEDQVAVIRHNIRPRTATSPATSPRRAD